MSARRNGQWVKLMVMASVWLAAAPLPDTALAAIPKHHGSKKIRTSSPRSATRSVAQKASAAQEKTASHAPQSCSAASNGGIKGKWCAHYQSCIPPLGLCPGEEEVEDEATNVEALRAPANGNKPKQAAASMIPAMVLPEVDAALARRLEAGDALTLPDIFTKAAQAVAAAPSRSEVANVMLPSRHARATD